MERIANLYERALQWPRTLLGLLGLVCLIAALFVPRFSFDASADTLVVEGDPGLEYYRQMASRFGGDEFLILTFTARDSALFNTETLANIAALSVEVGNLDGVRSVFSILDAPLFENRGSAGGALPETYRTLRDADVDLARARAELVASPLFGGYLVSTDARSTALRLDLEAETELDHLQRDRDRLRALADPDSEDLARLAEVERAHVQARDDFLARRDRLIGEVRSIRERYGAYGTLYLGGVPMIADDMINYVKRDMVVFGAAVLVIVTCVLTFFFRRVRWVVLPIANSALAVLLTVAWLGVVQRPATVVSANFIAVLAIVTISLTIHLIVRHRELLAATPEIGQRELVPEVMRSKFAPCLYTALTTMVAFGSLISSRIVPVVDFGWMMCVGVLIAFLVTYTFFPAMLLLLGMGAPSDTVGRPLWVVRVATWLAQLHSGGLVLGAAAVFAVAVFGITRLELNDRFVDYFGAESEIHQGMRFIDAELGGTVPLDVIVRLDPMESLLVEDDDFATGDEGVDPERYWFTPDKLDLVERLHSRLEAHPAVGKVISVATLERIGRRFTDGEPLDAVQIVAMLTALSPEVRRELVTPYASPATGELRIAARIRESGPRFDRDELLGGIREFAQVELGLAADAVHVTGMFVLFNDMLTQLLTSQAATLAYVLLATLVMFVVLLRSAVLGLIGLLPNLFAAGCIIGIMGLASIPLDMMTITIAAITIGIGVDDTIHYLHRYREELHAVGEVRLAALNASTSVGRAMYFTSITITAGFSILAFSSFEPTVHFGLLTALAMILAIAGDLALLPALLIWLLRRRGMPRGRDTRIEAP